MGLAKSGRRSICVGGAAYLWAVSEDVEAFYSMVAMVISHDKKFYVRYALSQSANVRHLIVKVEGTTRRYLCPQFGSSEAFTPRDVRALIDWCKSDLAGAVEVDWRGDVLTPRIDAP
jgi:hypothetical protein